MQTNQQLHCSEPERLISMFLRQPEVKKTLKISKGNQIHIHRHTDTTYTQNQHAAKEERSTLNQSMRHLHTALTARGFRPLTLSTRQVFPWSGRRATPAGPL